MSKLSYRTIADERPQGKPNVYFSCHPDDFDKFFEEYAAKILEIQDCAIWYEAEPEADYDREDLELNLSQMQLVVMPVTTKLLTASCRAMEVELPLAKEKHIPVLPLMMEQGLDEMFVKHFGDLQYLDPNNKEETKRKFDEVLENYIKSVLTGNELAEKVRAAFDAYIFLSYRKKDRRKAQELMRLIHRNPLCRNIAIWYDEFLTPGEEFNQAIVKILKMSRLFALVVTPNLMDEGNYVMTEEYPAAMDQGKPVLPVEMEETDRKDLEDHYPAIPPCVPGEENDSFREALLEKVKTLAVSTNDSDPEHNFLIGLAYLDGIDVEVDTERALELITGAAEAGVPEAMRQLTAMYETGKGVARDYREGVKWRKKHVDYLRKEYEAEPTESRADQLTISLWRLGDAQYALRMLDAAEKTYNEMQIPAERLAEFGNHRSRRYFSVSYEGLGNVAKAKGDLEGAQAYYEKCLSIDEELVAGTGTVQIRRDLSISIEKLGDIAKERGDLKGAQRYYEKFLAIVEKIAEETGTAQARSDLSLSYSKLGDIAMERGDLEEAQICYEKSFAIREKLAKEIGTAETRRDLFVSYFKLGSIEKEKGDLERAQEYCEKGCAINEELVGENETVKMLGDLCISYNKLGDIAMERGDLERAQGYYEKGFVLNEKLAREIATVEARRMLFICFFKLGDVSKSKGDLEGAQEYYEKCIALSEELGRETGAVKVRHDLALCFLRLGDTAEAMGNPEAAREYFEKSLAITEELVRKVGMRQMHKELSYILLRLRELSQNNE